MSEYIDSFRTPLGGMGLLFQETAPEEAPTAPNGLAAEQPSRPMQVHELTRVWRPVSLLAAGTWWVLLCHMTSPGWKGQEAASSMGCWAAVLLASAALALVAANWRCEGHRCQQVSVLMAALLTLAGDTLCVPEEFMWRTAFSVTLAGLAAASHPSFPDSPGSASSHDRTADPKETQVRNDALLASQLQAQGPALEEAEHTVGRVQSRSGPVDDVGGGRTATADSRPRPCSNPGTSCFINATAQALFGCSQIRDMLETEAARRAAARAPRDAALALDYDARLALTWLASRAPPAGTAFAPSLLNDFLSQRFGGCA